MSDDDGGLPFDVPRDGGDDQVLEVTVEVDAESAIEDIEELTAAFEDLTEAARDADEAIEGLDRDVASGLRDALRQHNVKR